MKFTTPLVPGILLKRYKRFLADVKLESGEVVVAHCTNTGSMKSCIEENAPVYLTPVNDPKRKTKFTWEMIRINDSWVGINTSLPNKFGMDAVKKQIIPGLEGYTEVTREVKFGDSRFDLKLENKNEICFVEIKNVTYKVSDKALFPDSVSTRGTKHLNTLIKVKNDGMRAVMLYIIQRMDVDSFSPAKEIDKAYAETLLQAYKAGVEIIPVQVKVSPTEVVFHKVLPFSL